MLKRRIRILLQWLTPGDRLRLGLGACGYANTAERKSLVQAPIPAIPTTSVGAARKSLMTEPMPNTSPFDRSFETMIVSSIDGDTETTWYACWLYELQDEEARILFGGIMEEVCELLKTPPGKVAVMVWEGKWAVAVSESNGLAVTKNGMYPTPCSIPLLESGTA